MSRLNAVASIPPHQRFRHLIFPISNNLQHRRRLAHRFIPRDFFQRRFDNLVEDGEVSALAPFVQIVGHFDEFARGFFQLVQRNRLSLFQRAVQHLVEFYQDVGVALFDLAERVQRVNVGR